MNRRRILVLACAVIVAICLYEIVSTVYIIQTSGVVQLSSSDKKAVLSISQVNHQAVAVGTGTAKVRLRPGSYQISASDNGYQTTMTIQVRKKQSVVNNLALPVAAQASSSSKLFSKLPFLGPGAEYQISNTIQASGNSSGPVVIIVSSSAAAKQNALQWISNEGFNPNNYAIRYQTVQLQNYHYTSGLP